MTVLRSVGQQSDPRVQTMIGFSLRKMGMVDEAMAYYTAALATDAKLTSTRQYLGEAFLQKGDKAAAREQLATIASLCGTDCADYRALAKPELVQTLREHRLKSGAGQDLIDVLIRRLQARLRYWTGLR